jgi:hypothetical protein
MKKLVRLCIAISLLTIFNLSISQKELSAQMAPPPPPPEKGESGNRGPLGEGAKLGDGAWILVALVISYGFHTYKIRRKHDPLDE